MTDCISVCLSENDHLKPTDIIILQRDDGKLNDWHTAQEIMTSIPNIKQHRLWVNNDTPDRNGWAIVAVVRLYD